MSSSFNDEDQQGNPNPYRLATSANVHLYGGYTDNHHRTLHQDERGPDPHPDDRLMPSPPSQPIIHHEAPFDQDEWDRWCAPDEDYQPPNVRHQVHEEQDSSILSTTTTTTNTSSPGDSTQITSINDDASVACSDMSKSPSHVICPQCQKVYTRSSINKHIKRVHMDKETYKYQCERCPERFFQRIELQNHTSTHRELRSVRYLCPHPGCVRATKGHTKRDNTVRHIKQAHPEYCLEENERAGRYGPVLKPHIKIESVPWHR